MKFLFSLAAALLSLGHTQPTLSAPPPDSVVILQCSAAGNSIFATAATESRGIRKVVINNECADELELYLKKLFVIKSAFVDQNGSTVTYTLIGP